MISYPKNISKFVLFASIGTLLCASSKPSEASTTVAADGAVSVNINYDEGKSSTWYIELQRDGAQLVQDGIAVEDDAEIRNGLLELDWGFNHESANGSFGTTQDAFHSISLFDEAAARTVIMLKNYHPVTYTLDTSYYSSHVSRYTSLLHTSGLYMTTPSVATAGQAGDSPYTHRRYLLAAMLAEIGYISNDSSMTADGLQYARNGIALQITSGTSPNKVKFPSGVTEYVSMVGVDPELGGYDVEYQMAGLQYLEWYYPYCTDASTRTKLENALQLGLAWEDPWVATDGTISYTGSTRVGVEKNRDGSIKQPDASVIGGAFIVGYNMLHMQDSATAAIRMMEGGENPVPQTVGSDGAYGNNYKYESGAVSGWSISNQKSGVTVLEAGIQREDATLIKQGCTMIDWGYKKQSSNGSFGTTTAPFSGVVTFVESTARAAALLNDYTPSSYGDSSQESYYAGEAKKWIADGALAAKWLTSSSIWNSGSGYPDIDTSPMHLFSLSAMLTEQGVLSDNTTWENLGISCAKTAVGLQQSNGTFEENGSVVFNDQAYSTEDAEYTLKTLATSNSLYSSLLSSINKSLVWFEPYINSSGTIINTSSPDNGAVSTCFGLGTEITGTAIYNTIQSRMSWIKTNNTLNP